MKQKKFIISMLILLFSTSLFSLEAGETFTKKYKTGDQLEYPFRSILGYYDNPPAKNIIYHVLNAGNSDEFDLKVDDFIFRVKKGDKYQTYIEKKGTAEGLQMYTIKYYLNEEIVSVKNNQIEINYTVTKVEKFLKGKGLKSEFEQVSKFPWE